MMAHDRWVRQLTALVALGDQALAEPDPWTALVTFIAGAAELLTADRGLRQIFMFSTFGNDHASRTRAVYPGWDAAYRSRAV